MKSKTVPVLTIEPGDGGGGGGGDTQGVFNKHCLNFNGPMGRKDGDSACGGRDSYATCLTCSHGSTASLLRSPLCWSGH